MEHREFPSPEALEATDFFEWADREYPEEEALFERQRRNRIVLVAVGVAGAITFLFLSIVLAFS